MSMQSILVFFLGVVGLVWYYTCLISIGYWPLEPGETADAFRQFMSLSVTTIAVSLATFVGMLLGIRGVSENARKGVKALRGVGEAHAVAAQLSQASPILQGLLEGSLTTRLQWSAAGLYVLSLLIALGLWWHGGDATDPAVSNLAKSILGLIGGALSIVLNLS
jgi:hypothetical protein